MLFKPVHVPMILDGTKTQTRRLWKRPMVKVGGLCWAQTRFCDPTSRFARLYVLRLWQERLFDISEEDAVAEGYPNRHAYIEAFYRINPACKGNPEVTCVEFAVVKGAS